MVLRPCRSAEASYPVSDYSPCMCLETMSTSVYNPFTFSEVSRLRANGSNRRPPVDAGALARARRDLFGPVNHEDTRKFVMRELAVQQKLSTGRWGFDFVREEPCQGEDRSDRYDWEKVSPTSYVPTAYNFGEYHLITSSENLTASPQLEEADTSADAAPTPPASPLEAAAATCPSTSPSEMQTAKPTVLQLPQPRAVTVKRSSSLKSSMKRTRQIDAHQQRKITDFLRIRKSTPSAKLRRLTRLDVDSDTSNSVV